MPKKTNKTKRDAKRTKNVKKSDRSNRSIAFNVSVPSAFLKKVDTAAGKKHMSRSAYVRDRLMKSVR